MFQKKPLEIYTDGSQKGKWASWAYVIVKKDKILQQKSARLKKATSNEMEFQAAIEALKSLPKKSKAILFSDSKILIDTLLGIDPGPKNQQEQIQVLKLICLRHELSFQWLRSHSGHKYNEICDTLCRSTREKLYNAP